MCEKAVEDDPEAIEYVADHFKTKEMCKEAVCGEPYALGHIPGNFKIQKMCEKDVLSLHAVPGGFKN